MLGFKVLDAAKKRADEAMRAAFGDDAAAAAPTATSSAAPVAPATDWNAIEQRVHLAMEHAGISGVDVQIDDQGFATMEGYVLSDDDRDTVIGLLERYPLTGLDVRVTVVPPEPEPEAPAAAPVAAPAADVVVRHTVKAGESWWGIAQRFYGNGRLHAALKAHNGNPRMLHPGHVVELPPVERLPKV
jgi:hypothetical protein